MISKVIKKNYNSIGHFSFSRLGDGDHYICEGHERIFTKQARDWKDLIIVTEKLDGANMGILKKDDKIYPITRNGYNASEANFEHQRLFSKWVNKYYDYFYYLLENNERICGEWMILAHGTKYKIESEHDLFRPFDIIKDEQRLSYLELRDRIKTQKNAGCILNLKLPELLHIGSPVNIIHIEKKLKEIDKTRLEPSEGAVYRCERGGKYEMIAKYVRQGKKDGIYLKDNIFNYNKELL